MHQKFLLLMFPSFVLMIGYSLAISNENGKEVWRNVDDEYDPEAIANALAFLEELERRHGFNARPRTQFISTRSFSPEVAHRLIGYFILDVLDKVHSHQHRPRYGKRGKGFGIETTRHDGQLERELNLNELFD